VSVESFWSSEPSRALFLTATVSGLSTEEPHLAQLDSDTVEPWARFRTNWANKESELQGIINSIFKIEGLRQLGRL
jgi:hypothetical protein